MALLQRYAVRVTSTIKGGVDVDLERKTLLLGPNESRKSAVTDALALALTGRVPEVAGKDRAGTGSANKPLTWLVAEGQPVQARVELSDGTAAYYETTGGQATWTLPGWMSTAGIFDLAELRLQLRDRGDAARKRYFLDHAATEFTEADVLQQLPQRLHEVWHQLARGQSGSAVEQLIVVRTKANTEFRRVRAERKGAEGTLEDLSRALGRAPTAGDLDRVKQNLAVLEERDRAARLAQTRQEHLDRVHAEQTARAKSYQEQAKRAETELARLRAFPPAASAVDVPMLEGLVMVAQAQARSLDNGTLDHCVLCTSPLVPETARMRADQVREAVDAALEGARKRATWEARVAQEERKLAETRKSAKDADAYARNAEADAGPAIPADPNARDAYEKALQEVAKLEIAEGATARVQGARERVDRLEQQEALFQDLVKRCEVLATEMLAGAVRSIETRVSKYLPEGEQFRLLLEFRGVECCLCGLERAGTVHVALSQSTWDRVVLAVAAGLSEGSDYALLLGEDRAYDPETLACTMRALRSAPAQIVLASPTKYKGVKPAG